MTATDPPSTLFFYGTLMVLPVLQRVIGRDGEGLAVSDAILEEHTRHHVKGEGAHFLLPFTDKSLDTDSVRCRLPGYRACEAWQRDLGAQADAGGEPRARQRGGGVNG